MTRWALGFFLAPAWFLGDGWLAERGVALPALTFGLCLALALFVRVSALPGLLLCAALARSTLAGGEAALHLLALGVPVAAVLPLRVLVSRRHWLCQALVAGFLAVTVPKATALVGLLSDAMPPAAAPGLPSILAATLVVPPVAFVLRGLPPLRAFRERAE